MAYRWPTLSKKPGAAPACSKPFPLTSLLVSLGHKAANPEQYITDYLPLETTQMIYNEGVQVMAASKRHLSRPLAHVSLPRTRPCIHTVCSVP